MINEGLRIFYRSLHARKHGVRRFQGSADEICRQIVNACFNGEYFQTSLGHFSGFYIRDFGWCVDSLIRLGYEEEVRKTLEYALSKYSKQGLSTTITPDGKCVDIFTYAPDSLAFLVKCLKPFPDLVEKNKMFLAREARRFELLVMENHRVRKKRFSSIKDQSIRYSSAYDNSMAAMLARDAKDIGIISLLDFEKIRENLVSQLWNGEYFYDDLAKEEYVAGDANLFPYWTGVVDDREMLKKSIKAIQSCGLDKPFPLKYTKDNRQKMSLVSFFSHNYEGSAIWMHMGPLYVSVVRKIDPEKADEYHSAYKKIIETHANFLEVFTPGGKPFKTPFYFSDEGMLWACNYL